MDEAIAGKGWKKVDEGQANIHVVLHGATADQAQRQHVLQRRHGRLRLPLRRHGGMGTSSTVVSEFTVGTLVVDMFDAKSKNLVFRGIAEDEISDNAEKNAKRLEKASTKMFKNFPPAPKKK